MENQLINEEAERGVLGSCLYGSHTGQKVLPIDIAMDAGCNADWFYTPMCRSLWESLEEMHGNGAEIDLLTVGERLSANGKLDSIGGYTALETLLEDTPTCAHLEYYLGFVQTAYKKRTVKGLAQDLVERVQIPDAEVDVLISRFTNELDEIISGRERKTIREHMADNIKVLRDAVMGISSGLPLPWKMFSDRTGGIQVKSVCPLVGRDGKGKSGAAAQIADFWVGEGIPTLYFSNEDDPRRTLLRMAGCRKWFSARDFEMGSSMIGNNRVTYTKSEANEKERKLDDYTDWLEGRKIEVIDGDFTGEQVHTEIKAFRRRHNLKSAEKIGVIVDGFKDLEVSGGDGTTAEEKHTAKQLFKAAKRCNAGLIVVSHITKIADDVAIIKENIKGSGTQFQGARQCLIFQDAGLPQILDENFFVLSATKANFAHGGSAVLRRDETVLKYQEM